MSVYLHKGFIAVAICGSFVAASPVLADALVVTKAMTASTVAEFYVQEEVVRVKLEIGVADLNPFRNLLPDEIYAKVAGVAGPPLEQRLGTFFREGLVLQANDGDPLPGRVKTLNVRPRVVRDEVTGEPLAEQPENGELVVYAELEYEFDSLLPVKLSIQPPTRDDDSTVSANIGFVAYHDELPVNDFRYLAAAATLDLNWDDPWYSRFQNRNLWRENAAPILAYLYVEPFEVRQEIIVRPKDLQKFVDLGLDDAKVIPVEQQASIKQRVAQFLSEKNPVLIDGQVVTGQLDRIHFVRRSLWRTGIVDPPEELTATSATLGAIFVYPIESLPQEVTMQWELFDDHDSSVPASATDEAGPMPVTLTPQEPVLRWQNFLQNPTVPTFATIAPPPQPAQVPIPLVTLICGIALVPLGTTLLRTYQDKREISGKRSLLCLTAIVVGLMAFPYARLTLANPFVADAQLTDTKANAILQGLIHNVYRAFDRRDKSLIYDQLSRSIAGDLLEQVYLETRKIIEVENQGGLRIKVNEVVIEDLERVAATGGEYTFGCRWRVAGAVGHWGHIHSRENEVAARLTIADVNDSWKIVAMHMIHEPSPRSSAPTDSSSNPAP